MAVALALASVLLFVVGPVFVVFCLCVVAARADRAIEEMSVQHQHDGWRN